MRRGISPVIATVIIVAVAIAISIAVAGWLMGLWGTFGTTEQIQVLPTTTLNTTTLHLCVKNTGSKTVTVSSYEIVGVTNGPVDLGTNSFTLTPGQQDCQDITITGEVNAGAQYLIKVYTDTGTVSQGYVVAQSG